MSIRSTSVRVVCASAVGALAVACQSEPSVKPLTSESFYRERTPSADVTIHPLDKANPAAEQPASGQKPVQPDPAHPLVERVATPDVVEAIPRYVRENVPAMSGTTAPTSLPTTTSAASATQPAPGGVPLGAFQVVGFVVAEVNGQPIYADAIIKQLNSALAAEARRLDREAFKRAASQLVAKKVQELVYNELEVAAADNALNADDRRLADALTTQWRAQEITRNGGSAQLAAERYKAQGLDFEQQVREQYRANLVRVFYRKKIVPLIHVGADDIREYYRKNIQQYTQDGAATFRLIKIDPKLHSGRDAAEERADQIRQRAATEDFAALAASDANDDKAARATGGLVEGMKKGSYVLEKVEEAVWKTPPGEVTPVVADRGAFYVAKVESRTEGSVASFDDVKVQEEIRNKLSGQQFQKFREETRRRLERNAVVRGGTPNELEVALDMAMQGYDQWAAAE